MPHFGSPLQLHTFLRSSAQTQIASRCCHPHAEREGHPWRTKRFVHFFMALCLGVCLACLAFPGIASPAKADEVHPSAARILYHFAEPDQIEPNVPFTDRTIDLTSVSSGKRWCDGEHTYIRANCHPALLATSSDNGRFRVLKDYASTSEMGKGTQDITTEATYNAEEGIIELPAHYAEDDLTVAWYVPIDQKHTELPVNVKIVKSIDGVASEKALEQVFSADSPTINLKLFDDEEKASHVETIRVMQGGSELSQYVYQNGSICISASPLGGTIEIALDDGNETQTQSEDQESAFNTEPPLFSLFSAANPVVGERFSLDADSALIRTCESGGNMAAVMGWPEKSGTYGFAVHFNQCINPEVVNADQNHVAPGGIVHTPGGGSYDYNYVKGMHFAWGECGGNVDNNGAGEPKVQSGWVEVTAVDYATQTVSYRFFLDVCSDIDGHNMQNIVGTFQVHEDLVGYLKLNKQSILPDISNNNPCYSLAGAKYGIYADEACTNLKQTLTTDAQGCTRSKALSVGTYYVKELSAPDGFALDSSVHEAPVSAGKTNEVTLNEVPQNDPTPILLAKHDSDYAYNDSYNNIQGGASSFAGAEFTIRFFPTLESDYGKVEPLRTWVVTTDERGIIDLRKGDGCKISGDGFFHDTTGTITLPIGTYEIRETKAPTGYKINESAVVRTVTGCANSVEAVSSYNTPIIADSIMRGGLELEKRDAESKLQSALGSGTLDNTTFTITNSNSHEVKVDGIFYQPGEVCATLVAKEGKAALAPTTLPYGEYTLTEVSAGDGYNLSDGNPRPFSITADGQIVRFSDSVEGAHEPAFKNFVKRGDLNFIKVREVNNERLVGVPFRITSQTTGEAHVVVTDANGEIDTSSAFVKHTHETNANDEEEERKAGRGVWFGKASDTFTTEARDDLGALPYDTYTLEELPCAANEGLELVTTTFSIYREKQRLDFGVIENHDPAEPWIVTTASDANDRDKFVSIAQEGVINDHVRYGNLETNSAYTLRATLVDPETGSQLEGAAGETTFTPSAASGTTEVKIPLDGLAEAPQDVVVYETLLKDDEVILEHHERDNSEQTVSTIRPRIATTALDESDGDHEILNDAEVHVIDTVAFENLSPDKPYRIVGTLMKKEADEQGEVQAIPLTDDAGAVISSETTFSPQAEHGSIEVSFNFNASALGPGTELVVYEKLLCDESEIATHEDPEDENQTVRIVAPEEPPAASSPDEPVPASEAPTPEQKGTFAKTGSALLPLLIAAGVIVLIGISFIRISYLHRKKAQSITAAIAANMLGSSERISQ